MVMAGGGGGVAEEGSGNGYENARRAGWRAQIPRRVTKVCMVARSVKGTDMVEERGLTSRSCAVATASTNLRS